MGSGWIINYKDGESVIFTEERYKEYEATVDYSLVASEEHWYSIKEAIRNNPTLEIFD